MRSPQILFKSKSDKVGHLAPFDELISNFTQSLPFSTVRIAHTDAKIIMMNAMSQRV